MSDSKSAINTTPASDVKDVKTAPVNVFAQSAKVKDTPAPVALTKEKDTDMSAYGFYAVHSVDMGHQEIFNELKKYSSDKPGDRFYGLNNTYKIMFIALMDKAVYAKLVAAGYDEKIGIDHVSVHGMSISPYTPKSTQVQNQPETAGRVIYVQYQTSDKDSFAETRKKVYHDKLEALLTLIKCANPTLTWKISVPPKTRDGNSDQRQWHFRVVFGADVSVPLIGTIRRFMSNHTWTEDECKKLGLDKMSFYCNAFPYRKAAYGNDYHRKPHKRYRHAHHQESDEVPDDDAEEENDEATPQRGYRGRGRGGYRGRGSHTQQHRGYADAAGRGVAKTKVAENPKLQPRD